MSEYEDLPPIPDTAWTVVLLVAVAAMVLVAALVLALTVDTGPADAPTDAPSGERAEPEERAR